MAKQKKQPQGDQPSTTKAIFNIAVQTQRTELIHTIKEPLVLSLQETRNLAAEIIALKTEVADWKEKWERRKDTMTDWLAAVVEAQKHLNTITDVEKD